MRKTKVAVTGWLWWAELVRYLSDAARWQTRMRGVKLVPICHDVGPRRTTAFPVITLESAVFQSTARTISLLLLFVKGVILTSLSSRFHQPQRLKIIRHRCIQGGQTGAAAPHTYSGGPPLVAVLSEILRETCGATGGGHRGWNNTATSVWPLN